MSIRVLIVDDEKLERVLILKALNWEQEGFEIIGEAGNGEEALEFYKMKSPDLVITDINMPYKDGVELAEEIKRIDSDCRIIMVTGYREFEYARRALRVGVEDFLLKPINIDEIQTIVRKMRTRIEEQNGKQREYKSLKEKEQQTQYILLESFLQRLVENRIEEEEAIRKLKIYNLERLMSECVCMNVKIEKSAARKEDKIYDINVIYSQLSEKIHPYISFIHYMDNLIFYFVEQSIEEVCAQGKELIQWINSRYQVQVEVGISQKEQGYKGISKAYRETEKSVNASLVLGKNQCITYEMYQKAKSSGQDKCEIRWKDFIFNVESGVWNKVEEDIIRYCDYLKEQQIPEKSYIQLMGMDIIAKASTILAKHGKSIEEVVDDNLYESIAQIENITELKEYLKKVLHEIMKYADSIRTKKGNSLIDSAVQYIDRNLKDSELTLKKVAGELYVNESYLSRSFKQETGESMIEYITRNRIEESIRLLNTTDMKAYEISEYVGIKDPHYFSICFKKQVGVTIKEYKNRGQM
ncbi:MAG: response regulator [Lachnospiraceae bacterium]|nr:response regulator [Lachnospiraceae bacterium]